MTTIARQLPSAQRAIAALDRCKSAVSIRDEASNVDVQDHRSTHAGLASRRAALSEYAWIEAAALAGTRTPRG